MKFAEGAVLSSCRAASSEVYSFVSWFYSSLGLFCVGWHLVCFDVSSEPNVEGLDGLFHALAVSSDDRSVEDGGGFGDVGDVFPIVELGEVFLRWEL